MAILLSVMRAFFVFEQLLTAMGATHKERLRRSIMDEETQELETPETQEEETEEKETVFIDDQEVEWDSVVKAYKDMQNNENWQATNTQKAQEIAAEKQRLEEERQKYEQLRRDTELLLQRQNYQQPPQEQQQDKFYGLSQEDFEELTPFEQTVLKKQYEQEKAWKSWQEENQRKEFYNQTQAEHSRLKSLYQDYDPGTIERSIIQGRESQFEDVYLAESYKRLKNGDPNAIKGMIPQSVMDEIKKEVRNQVLEEVKKKEQMKSKLSTVSPEKPGLPKLPLQPAKNYHDVQENVIRRLREQGISLTS